MFKIPTWMIEIIEQFMCPKCKKHMIVQNVSSIGIRKSYRNENKEALYVEYRCSSCSEKTNIEMQDMTLGEFAITILNELEEHEVLGKDDSISNSMKDPEDGVYKESDLAPPENNNNSRIVKSKITRKEIQEFKEKLKENNDMYDFGILLNNNDSINNRFRSNE